MGDVPPPPPPAEFVEPPPRAGELTNGWRIVTACTWIAVIVAFAAVWNTSVQLGLSTWWLGARAEPRPLFVRLLPFVAPTLMALATFNNARWLAWWGMGAAAVTAAIGLGDLGRVWELAVLELVIAGLALLVAVASLTGTFRPIATEPPS
jgi:hypothetical protein